MGMEYFCAYNSYLESLQDLTDEECGRLFRACLEYSKTCQIPDMQGNEKFAFAFIKRDIDAARENYNRRCESNRANIQKRWHPDAAKTKDTTVYGRKNGNTNLTKEKEKEKEIKKEKEKEKEKNIKAIVDAWNKLGVSQINRMSADSNRYKMLKARLNQYGLDEILRAIKLVRDSDFLMGRAKDFLITFDWFVKPNNFDKILSGNYNNRSPGGGATPGKPKTWAELAAEMEAEG